MTSAFRVMLPWCIILAIGGCGITSADMVPERVADNQKHIDASVTVMDVTGDRESYFGGALFVSNEQFKDALRKTLEGARLFRSVQDRDGDLLLYARIKNQGQVVGFALQYTGTIAVEYLFLRASDRHAVWDETFDSEFSSTTFSGAARTIRAREGSVRENLAALLKAIAKSWPG